MAMNEATGASRMTIGLDIGGTNMRAALVDDTGQIVDRFKITTEIASGATQAVQRLTDECRRLMKRAIEMRGIVLGVGLGVAGKIDAARGLVVFSPNLPAMRDYPLAAELQEKLHLPVVMENDANAFGLGEKWVGLGRRIRNWIGLTLGTGVGGCLFLDDRLWNGDDLGFAGEIGHMIVDPNGPLCACGLRGCLEAHSSGRALVEGVAAAVSKGEMPDGPLHALSQSNSLSPLQVYQFAQDGNPVALRLFERMGWALGLALANLFTVLGIRHAIIGGGVSAGWDLFAGALNESLAKHSSMLDVEDMEVWKSTLGDDAAVLGVAWLARKRCDGNRP